jgi:hypothetical protein
LTLFCRFGQGFFSTASGPFLTFKKTQFFTTRQALGLSLLEVVNDLRAKRSRHFLEMRVDALFFACCGLSEFDIFILECAKGLSVFAGEPMLIYKGVRVLTW